LLLMQALVKNTSLGVTQPTDKGLVEKATEKAGSVIGLGSDNLAQLLGQEPAARKRDAKLESIVDDKFEDLRRFVTSSTTGQPAPITATMTLLNDLYRHLVAVDAALKNKTQLPPPEVPNRVKQESARLPEPVRGMVQTVAGGGATATAKSVRERLSSQLDSDIGEFCKKAIEGRYPFVRSSKNDVRPDDFSSMFKPGGRMDAFFQQNLAQYVDTSTQPWRFRTEADISLGSSTAIREFQRAAVIRDVFFRGPSIRLEFTPIEMDASITQFLLDVDGQPIRYAHGPQVPTVVQWPGTKGTNQVRLQISPQPPTGSSGFVNDGPWALFRMLDRAEIDQSEQPERFRVTFSVEGRKATFDVLASSVQNPFRLQELTEFHCPTRL
jgi:type VI secretion system protein ImpL